MLTRHAEKLPEEMREDLRRHKEEASERLRAHLERLMEEKGIEDLEELYERFVQTEYAYIPVPGLHRGKPVSFEQFKLHAARRHPYVYGEFAAGLVQVLGLSDEEARKLSFFYLLGEEPPRA